VCVRVCPSITQQGRAHLKHTLLPYLMLTALVTCDLPTYSTSQAGTDGSIGTGRTAGKVANCSPRSVPGALQLLSAHDRFCVLSTSEFCHRVEVASNGVRSIAHLMKAVMAVDCHLLPRVRNGLPDYTVSRSRRPWLQSRYR
jgi:hypothetical protein